MRNLYRRLCGSRLAQAGASLVVLGALVEALEALGTVDLSQLPVVGPHAGAILAGVGVLKIVLRLSMALVGGLSVKAGS